MESNSGQKPSSAKKKTFDIRIVVCCAGIVFFAMGIWMVKTGIAASGVIDIEFRELLKGHFETGNAGLFIVVLSFVMILASPFLGERTSTKPEKQKRNHSHLPVMVTVMVIVWAIAGIAMVVTYNMSNKDESIWVGAFAFNTFLFASKITFMTYDQWKKQIESTAHIQPTSTENKLPTKPPQ